MCKCQQWIEIVLGIVVFVLAVWPNLLGATTKWILVLAALILLFHGIFCKKCWCCESETGKKATRTKK